MDTTHTRTRAQRRPTMTRNDNTVLTYQDAPASGRRQLRSWTRAPYTALMAATEARDPVCGMTVRLPSERFRDHGGERYYFCGERCRTKFGDEPEKYIQPREPTPAPAEVAPGTLYTCPMHPEVVQVG